MRLEEFREKTVRLQRLANSLPHVADRHGLDALAEVLKEALGEVVDMIAGYWGFDEGAIKEEALREECAP